MDVRQFSLALFVVVEIAYFFSYLFFRYEGHAELYQITFYLNVATWLTFIVSAAFAWQSFPFRWLRVALAFIIFWFVPSIALLTISYGLAKNGFAMIWIEISFAAITALKIAFAMVIYRYGHPANIDQPA